MNTLQYKALDAYQEWLDLPYQIHLTTRLPYSDQSAQQSNRWYARQVLTALAAYLEVNLSAVSVIVTHNPRHVHSLLLCQDSAIHIGKVAYFFDSQQSFDNCAVVATAINENTTA